MIFSKKLPFISLSIGIALLCSACDDIRTEEYPNGKIRFETPYVDDMKQGIQKEYYESGSIKKETPYDKDRREGVTKEYYEDGTLKAETPYVNGYIEGTVVNYHPNGKIAEELPYSQNKQTAFGKYYEASGEFSTSGSYKDPRDGIAYEWIKIGEQIWLAENVNYATANGSLCMQCNNWGRLYNKEAAANACPESFRIPTKSDWEVLLKFVGKDEGVKLKAGYGWDPLKGTAEFGNGKDDFGFGAKAGGAHFEKSDVEMAKRKFDDAGKKAYFWLDDGTVAVFHYNKPVMTFEKFNPEHGASLRCILK